MSASVNPSLARISGTLPNVSGGESLNRGISQGGPSFKDILNSQPGLPSAIKPAAGTEALKFSNHAVDRMQSRGIHFDQDTLARIENAVAKAAAKGAKETLLLTDQSALIVSVKNNTVVTVMDKQSLKDNVFTNIDSTVVI